mmetsp:Transcript_15354/g.38053  ORF Transcript_15354/g.38053 Transcript_15354/m.38053 type:complete len:1185 (+) Transcript_15354:94-3648(+)
MPSSRRRDVVGGANEDREFDIETTSSGSAASSLSPSAREYHDGEDGGSSSYSSGSASASDEDDEHDHEDDDDMEDDSFYDEGDEEGGGRNGSGRSQQDNESLVKEIALHRFSAFPSHGSPKTEALYLKILEDVRKEQALKVSNLDDSGPTSPTATGRKSRSGRSSKSNNGSSKRSNKSKSNRSNKSDKSNKTIGSDPPGHDSQRLLQSNPKVGFVEDYGDDELNDHSRLLSPSSSSSSSPNNKRISDSVALNLQEQAKRDQRRRRQRTWISVGIVVLVLAAAGIVTYFLVREDDNDNNDQTPSGFQTNSTDEQTDDVSPTLRPTTAPLTSSPQQNNETAQEAPPITTTSTNYLIIPDGLLLEEDSELLYSAQVIDAANDLALSVYLEALNSTDTGTGTSVSTNTSDGDEGDGGTAGTIDVRRRRTTNQVWSTESKTIRILQPQEEDVSNDNDNVQVESTIASWVEYDCPDLGFIEEDDLCVEVVLEIVVSSGNGTSVLIDQTTYEEAIQSAAASCELEDTLSTTNTTQTDETLPSAVCDPALAEATSSQPSVAPSVAVDDTKSEFPSDLPSLVPQSDVPSGAPTTTALPSSDSQVTSPTISQSPSSSTVPSSPPSISVNPTTSNAPSVSSEPTAPTVSPSLSQAPSESFEPSSDSQLMSPTISKSPSISTVPSSPPSVSMNPTTSNAPSDSSQPTAPTVTPSISQAPSKSFEPSTISQPLTSSTSQYPTSSAEPSFQPSISISPTTSNVPSVSSQPTAPTVAPSLSEAPSESTEPTINLSSGTKNANILSVCSEDSAKSVRRNYCNDSSECIATGRCVDCMQTDPCKSSQGCRIDSDCELESGLFGVCEPEPELVQGPKGECVPMSADNAPPSVLNEDASFEGFISFVAMADIPYNIEERYCLNEQLQAISEDFQSNSFIIHMGDIKNGTADCSEAAYAEIANIFSNPTNRGQSNGYQPEDVYFVIGDNEYQDCPDIPPETALQRWLDVFGPNGIFGKSVPNISRQEVRQENFAFTVSKASTKMLAIGLNLVGSDSTLDESQRFADNIAWVKDSLQTASAEGDGIDGLVVFGHASLYGDRKPFGNQFFDLLKDDYPNLPTLYLYGDAHRYLPMFNPNNDNPNLLIVQMDAGGEAPPLVVTFGKRTFGDTYTFAIDRQGGPYTDQSGNSCPSDDMYRVDTWGINI